MTEDRTKIRIAGPTPGALALFVVSVLLVVAGTGYAVWQGTRQAQALASELRALCAEQADVGQAPLPAKPSELGVKLIADFRNAYAGLGCSPALPPPSPLLRRLAARYGVPVTR
jgi:hypothetical protein